MKYHFQRHNRQQGQQGLHPAIITSIYKKLFLKEESITTLNLLVKTQINNINYVHFLRHKLLVINLVMVLMGLVLYSCLKCIDLTKANDSKMQLIFASSLPLHLCKCVCT